MLKKIISLFIIALLTVAVQAKSLIPGGESAGVILSYDGVLVTGSYAFSVNGDDINLNRDTFVSGDLIVSCYGELISNNDDLIRCIQKCINDNKEILVEVINHQIKSTKTLNVYFDESTQSFKTGLYITDQLTAVGTITFYDPETSRFGAFGHNLDVISSKLNFDACELFEAYITSIQKNDGIASGKKIGSIEKTKRIGNVTLNHELGIFGYYNNIYKDDLTLYETGRPEKGDAIIFTTLNDNITKPYTIYIDSVSNKNMKNIAFHITDSTLLNITNGIIPGMSGSPIIQNGKIVGAVTHVLVNNPQSGYGIYIEDMLKIFE